MIMDHEFSFLYHQNPFIGVRGRIETRRIEKEDEVKYLTEVIAEKVTFLSSKKQEEAE